MNVFEMTDADAYQLMLDELLEALGPFGLKRFLAYSKAARGNQAAPCHIWVTQMEKETILRGMQELRRRKPAVPPVQGGSLSRSESRDDISTLTDCELHELGLNAISGTLGLFGMAVFGQLCTPGTGNYTEERHKWLAKLDRETVIAQIHQEQKAALGSGKE